MMIKEIKLKDINPNKYGINQDNYVKEEYDDEFYGQMQETDTDDLWIEVIDYINEFLDINDWRRLTNEEECEINDIDLIGDSITINRTNFIITISTDDVNWVGISLKYEK